MQNLKFPLDFKFKIFTPSNDFSVFDADGSEVAYTRQKIFKIKEGIEIFQDASRKQRLYQINADRILDFNANYRITDGSGTVLGSVRRKGMRSLWRTHYQVYCADGQKLYDIREKNPWVAVLDGLVGDLPVIGWFTGYFFNPAYGITDLSGQEAYLLKKMPSFMERRFQMEKQGRAGHDELAVLSAMMLMLLERSDG